MGPPVRPEPATPHSTQTPGRAGYGRENFTVSRAPPGSIAATVLGRRPRPVCSVRAEDGSANDPPGERADRQAVRFGVAGIVVEGPVGARWGPRSERRSATPHNALTPRRGPATARGISPCRVRRWNRSRAGRSAPSPPWVAGSREGRPRVRRRPSVNPRSRRPGSAVAHGGASRPAETGNPTKRADPRRGRLRQGEFHRVACAGGTVAERVGRRHPRRGWPDRGMGDPGDPPVAGEPAISSSGKRCGARWGLPSDRSRQPHIALRPPKGPATAGRVSPCRVRRGGG